MINKNILHIYLMVVFLGLIVSSCNNDSDEGLAPYSGSPQMSNITVQDSSFRPRITWLGGYVSALGVNRGNRAALDSTLVWLIQAEGNNIHYPVRYGELPQGAVDLTSQFGGNTLDSLIEDETYTFWIVKDDVWKQISTSANKILILNAAMTSPFTVVADTVLINAFNHIQKTNPVDVYINIINVTVFGRLGKVNVTQTNTDNNPIVTWEITEAGVTDTLLSAMGLVEGQQFQVLNQRWEVWSEEIINGESVFGKKNIIAPPVKMGQQFPESRVFIEYPAGGLQRNKDYYVWIANSNWNGESRLRATTGYAWATFQTR